MRNRYGSPSLAPTPSASLATRFAPFLAMADARASNLAPDAMPPASNDADTDASNDAKRFKVDPVMSTSASLISLPSLTSTSPINEPGSRNEWAAKMAAAGGVVDLSNEGFLTPLRFGGIAHILSSPECCTTDLDLHHLSLGPVCSKLLAGAVASNSSLKRLNIERTGLGIAGGVALGEALRCNTTLVRLDMNVNDIAPLGGMAIAAGLQSHPSLTELSLAKCGLGPGGAKALGAALETNTSIRTLDMTQNDMGIEGGVAFGRALALNATLRSLSMRCNRISTGMSTERATAFADALEVNTTLTFLDFAQNELGPLGGAAFATAIERNNSLTTLDLQRNELGAAGGAALCTAVGRNTCLRTLNLKENEMGLAGARALSIALSLNTALTSLNVSQNDFGAEGGAAWAATLVLNTTLCSLSIDSNMLGEEGGEALATALVQKHPSLTFLSAASNGFGSSGASLGRAVRACTVLRKLVLEDNKIDDEGGVALCEAFAAQAELVDLNLAFNEISALPIECQLSLARKMASPMVLLDLSGNVLSSPPLAHRAAPPMLSDYLRLLAAEPHPLERLRLMVVGFGGVGKTTFCGAVTCPSNERSTYHASLSHCSTWDSRMMASWARGLATQRGHEWSEKVAAVLTTAPCMHGLTTAPSLPLPSPQVAAVLTEHAICGADLPSLLQSTEPGGAGGSLELLPVAEGFGALLGTAERPCTDFGPSPRLDALGSAGKLDPHEDLPCMQVLTTAPHIPLPYLQVGSTRASASSSPSPSARCFGRATSQRSVLTCLACMCSPRRPPFPSLLDGRCCQSRGPALHACAHHGALHSPSLPHRSVL